MTSLVQWGSILMVESCLIGKWSCIQMPFEYRTKFSPPVFKQPLEYRVTEYWTTGQVKICYSDVSVIHMFTIRILTVFG